MAGSTSTTNTSGSTSTGSTTNNSGSFNGSVNVNASANVGLVNASAEFGIDVGDMSNTVTGDIENIKNKIKNNYGVITDKVEVEINKTESPLSKDILKSAKAGVEAQKEIAENVSGIEYAIRVLTELLAHSHNFNVQKHSVEMMMFYELKKAINGETQTPATENLFTAQKSILEVIKDLDINKVNKGFDDITKLSDIADKIQDYTDPFTNMIQAITNLKLNPTINNTFKPEFEPSFSPTITNENSFTPDYTINFDTASLKTSLDNIKNAIDEKEISLEAGDITADFTKTNEALNSIADKLELFSDINADNGATLRAYFQEKGSYFKYLNTTPADDKSPREFLTEAFKELAIIAKDVNGFELDVSILESMTYKSENTQSSLFSKLFSKILSKITP